jgi:hypothetical protein
MIAGDVLDSSRSSAVSYADGWYVRLSAESIPVLSAVWLVTIYWFGTAVEPDWRRQIMRAITMIELIVLILQVILFVMKVTR